MSSSWAEPDPSPARSGRQPTWLILLGEAALLAILWRPRHPARPLDVGAFAMVVAVFLLGGLLVDDLTIELPRWSNEWAVTERSFPILLVLGLASAVAALAERHAVILRVAAAGLLAVSPALWLGPWLGDHSDDFAHAPWLPAAYLGLVAVQATRWIDPQPFRLRQAAAWLLAIVIPAASAQWLPYSPWWWTEEAEDTAEYTEPSRSWSAEQLWNRQPERVDAALAKLAEQRPGVIDLYAIGIAGDGGERVFRNEIELLQSTLGERFDAPQHLVPLVNHVDLHDDYPIASLTNLRRSLQGIASRMDPQEDILLLFITSHGSADHQIYLGLDPLPLDPLAGEQLRGMLDEVGIRWRVVVISACYSGGLLPALQSPETLVITAARADRTSFGCGSQSEITWFGQAFLAEALQRTTDLPEAFRLAKTAIARREQEQDVTPSFPQISRGEAIGRQLEAWRAQLPTPGTRQGNDATR